MRVLVTGSDGFIGGEIVRQLIGAEHDVIGLDAGTYAATPEQHDGIGFRSIRGDCCEAGNVFHLVNNERPELIIHAAAMTHVDRSIYGPVEAFRVNAMGTAIMLESARRVGARLCYVSTDEVFGMSTPALPADADDQLEPSSAYSAGKAAGELACMAYFRTYDSSVVITRGANTAGPWQHPEKFLPTIVRRLLAGQPVPVYGDGKQARTWCSVSDHAANIIRAAFTRYSGRVNLAPPAGRPLTNLEAIDIAARALNVEPKIQHVEDRLGHDRSYFMRGIIANDWTWEHTQEQAIVQAARWNADNRDWTARKMAGEDWSSYQTQHAREGR